MESDPLLSSFRTPNRNLVMAAILKIPAKWAASRQE